MHFRFIEIRHIQSKVAKLQIKTSAYRVVRIGFVKKTSHKKRTHLISSSQNKAFGHKASMFSLLFCLILASLMSADAYKTALFSNESPPRCTLFPVLMFFFAAQTHSHGPIPRVLEVTRHATNPSTLV